MNSKRKGKKGELEVVHFWDDLFPEARRHLEFQEGEAEQGVDVILDKATGIQVKVGKQVPKQIYKFIEQIKKEEGIYFVQCRRDRGKWLVILKAEDFKEILKPR